MMEDQNRRYTETKRTEPGHLSWLRFRASVVTEALLQTPEGALAQNCGEEIFQALLRQLRKASKGALDVLYYNRDIGDDDTEPDVREEMVKRACPRLMETIWQTEQFFSIVLSEAFSRTNEFREEIGRTLLQGCVFWRVKGLSLGAGDLHNHGRQVILFDTDAGKFVYKPHTLAPDRIMRRLSETFFPGIFYVPQVVCGDGFGFCEFVENRPAGTEEAAQAYYRRLGGFCAVSRILGTVDLHAENLLCRDAMPVLVDCETVFSPIPNRQGKLPFVETSLDYTLYYSSLLPGLMNGHPFSPLFDGSEKNISAPVIDGERKTLNDYVDSFLHGFRDGYRQGMMRREDLLAFANQIEDFPIRVVVRATAGYMKLLQRSRQWKWVSNPALMAEVKRVLSAAAVNGYVPGENQVDSETASILRGDIPYFTVQMDGHDLCDPDGIAEQDCAAESPREHLRQCIRLLSEQDLDFHCRLFKLALSKVLLPRRLPEPQIRSTQPLGDEECVQCAETAAEQVLNELLPGPRGGLCCFTLFRGKENAMEMAPYDLIHGRHGIGIFLAAMLKNSTNADLNTRLRAALDTIVSGMCEESELLVNGKSVLGDDRSFFAGIAGYLFAASLIWRYTGNEACSRLCGKLIAQISDAFKKELQPDVLCGGAGLLKLLCLQPELRTLPGAVNVIERIADGLMDIRAAAEDGFSLWGIEKWDKKIPGIGQGPCGIASALFLTGDVLKRNDFKQAAWEGVIYEAGGYFDALRDRTDLTNGALSGTTVHGRILKASRIGMNLLQMGGTEWDEFLSLAVDSCTDGTLLPLDSMGDGNCASADFLLEAGSRLDRPELMRKSRELLTAMVARAGVLGGYPFVPQSFAPVLIPGLFSGLSGVGYAMLRQVDHDLLSIML